MAINGIEIEVGQKWRTRDGRTAEVRHDDGHHDFPLDIVCGEEQWFVGRNGYEFGDIEYPDSRAVDNPDRGDLIELVEHADGFKPWAGGEQPEETRGKLVAYRLQNGESLGRNADFLVWGHFDKIDAANIVAYKVTSGVVQSVGEFASAASYSDHMDASEAAQPAPLRVELIEPEDDREYTGGSVSYYKVRVGSPTSGGEPYDAECNDIIEALGMSFAEGNAFKAIWRLCAARQGLSKRGYDEGVYDAEKVVFFGQRMVVQQKLEGGAK